MSLKFSVNFLKLLVMNVDWNSDNDMNRDIDMNRDYVDAKLFP